MAKTAVHSGGRNEGSAARQSRIARRSGEQAATTCSRSRRQLRPSNARASNERSRAARARHEGGESSRRPFFRVLHRAAFTEHGPHGRQPPYDTFWGARYAIICDPGGGIMSPSDEARRSGRRAPPSRQVLVGRSPHLPAGGHSVSRSRGTTRCALAGSGRASCGSYTACGVGDRGFEPRTSALSERRSNQLS